MAVAPVDQPAIVGRVRVEAEVVRDRRDADPRAGVPVTVGSDLDLRLFFEGEVDPGDAKAVTRAFRNAGEELAARGGGRLYVPPGRWLLEAAEDEPAAAVSLRTPGTTLCGAGILATTLKLAGRQDCHVVSIEAPGITVERLTVAGGLDHEPADVRAGRAEPERRCHGISIRECPAFTSIREVLVEDVVGYGIGSIIVHGGPKPEPDPYCHIRMHNVSLRRIGDDAIDFKIDVNPDPAADGPDPALMGWRGPRAFLRNIAVADHSLLSPNAAAPARGENGIDGRGQLHIQNVEVTGVRPGEFGKSGGAGITLRDEMVPGGGVCSASHGRGAQWSTLQNYFVSTRPAIPGEPKRGGGGIQVAEIMGPVVAVTNGNVVKTLTRSFGGSVNGQYHSRWLHLAVVQFDHVSDGILTDEVPITTSSTTAAGTGRPSLCTSGTREGAAWGLSSSRRKSSRLAPRVTTSSRAASSTSRGARSCTS